MKYIEQKPSLFPNQLHTLLLLEIENNFIVLII